MKKFRNSLIVTKDTQNREIIMQEQAPIVKEKEKNHIIMHIKSMALVLVVALVISALSAAIVHSLAKSCSDGSKTSRDNITRYVDLTKKDLSSTEIFTATGKKTDAGDWNCFNESGCARISGVFDPSTGKYHFAAKGMRAGKDHVSLSYKSEDGKWQTKNLTLTIDKNLNISVA